MLTQSLITDRGSTFTDLLFEWIEYPLLLAQDGMVVASNQRACEVCGRSSGYFTGLTLGSAIDLMYQSANESEIEVHRIAVEGFSYQVAVMRRAEQSAQGSKYRSVLQNGFDAFWTTTAEGKILEFSESYASLAGYPPEDLREMNISDVDPDGAGAVITSHLEAVQKVGLSRFSVRQRKGALPEWSDLEVTLSVLPKTGGHVLGSVRNVTRKKAAEAELERARRALRLTDACMCIAREAQDRRELLQRICESIVTVGGYAMAWIGVRDPEGGRAVRVDVAFGSDVQYLDEIYLDIEDTPLATPDATERVAICNIFGSAEYAPWREKAMEFGFASSLALAIRFDDRVDAALTVYSYEADAFEDERIEAVAQAVDALELGLELQRKRTSHKSLEKKASDWDEDFRAAFESSLNGILVYDLDGKILDANAEFCNRLGYTRQELVGMHLTQIEATEYARLAADRLAAIRNEGFAVFETAHIGRDGAVHPVAISCRTYTYGESQIVLAISRDLVQPPTTTSTERWLRLALEASRTGLFDWDLRTNKVAYSTEWKAQLGYKDEQISDDFGEWELRVHPDHVDRMVDELKAYLKKPTGAYESEFQMRHKNGSYCWILARGSILYDADGKPERMLGSHVDITDRKRAEMHSNQLQKLESVGRVADGVARDFDHLLTIINGYSDLILPELFDGDPLKPKIQAIRAAGERASSLTQQLLGFSQSRPLAPATVNLNTIVTAGEEMIRRLIGPGVELSTELSPEIPYVSADPRQLTLLLANLAINARDSMSQGGRLTISIQALEALPAQVAKSGVEPGPHIRLTVADTGSGMIEEKTLRVFDPFYTTSEGADRSGLGLATVFGIVQQHGGTIAVASDAAAGNRFQVYLPTAPRPEKGNAEDSPFAGRRSATILVMEEDAALRRLMVEALRGAGYQVTEAGNAGEALLVNEQADTSTDLLMTNARTDPAIIERLRLKHPTMKVVFATTPFTPTKLAKTVAETLARPDTDS